MSIAVVYLAYCEVEQVEQDGGGIAPMWNAEVLLDGKHVATHGSQSLDAVLGGAADVLRRRVGPAEPRAGMLSHRGMEVAIASTTALRQAAGLETE